MILSVLGINAQYTYFSETFGEFGDQETESVTNVEVVGDSIYMFGGIESDIIPFSTLLRIVDIDGDLIDERIMPKDYNSFLIGHGNAVSKTSDNSFLFTQQVSQDGGKGIAIRYNLSMDTLWEKTYDLYPSTSTYFRSNYSKNDVNLVLGEHNSLYSSFLISLSEEGEVIWNKALRNGIDGSVGYNNEDLIFLEDGYLIGGFRRSDGDIALLTKTDLEGNSEWEYYADNFLDIEGDMARTQRYRLSELPNGEIIGAHMILYEYYGPTSPPNTPHWYRSIHLSKINVADTSLYWEHDFFTDHEFEVGTILWKILGTEDNGVIMMGSTPILAENAWLCKIDSMGEMEWFNYYSLDISQTQETYDPRDIKQTSDGGFVVVGNYSSWNEDNYRKSWAMKIDACGDVEWQGCDYVGIQESKKIKVDVYPNPTSEFITIEGEELTGKTRVMIYDQLGSVVLDQKLDGNNQLHVGQLHSGLYQLMLVEEGVIVYSEKIVVR
jgi:hypothetical protein